MLKPAICKLGLLLLLAASNLGYAQQAAVLDSGSLDQQYDLIRNQSESYNQFKVIKRTSLDKFWENVTDTLSSMKNQQTADMNTINSQKSNLENLNSSLTTTKNELAAAVEERDGISFFGSLVSKGTYKVIMWALVALLAGLFAFTAMKFKNSNLLTVQAKKDHDELLEEFENFKERALERERKIKREMQTVMNKLEDLKKRTS